MKLRNGIIILLLIIIIIYFLLNQPNENNTHLGQKIKILRMNELNNKLNEDIQFINYKILKLNKQKLIRKDNVIDLIINNYQKDIMNLKKEYNKR